jgi:hypothetical protein
VAKPLAFFAISQRLSAEGTSHDETKSLKPLPHKSLTIFRQKKSDSEIYGLCRKWFEWSAINAK